MSTNTTPDILKQDEVTIMVFGTKYENLDTEGLEGLTQTVGDAAMDADPPLVVVDLSQTTYFASDFVSVLIDGWKKLKAHDGAKLALCGLTLFAAQVFAVVQLDKVWEVYPTRDEAVAALLKNSTA